MNRVAILRAICCLLTTELVGCLVTEKCYSDLDCGGAEVCSASGDCELQCLLDSDCDASFGTQYVCEDHHCVKPVACTLCVFDHAQASCVHGECTMAACESGFHDLNHRTEDGCEYRCTVTASPGQPEPCDGQDNDCDGEVDEDTALDSDPTHCGSCNHACPVRAHADPTCTSGQCRLVCHDGWYDNDHDSENGCEAAVCTPADEICDGQDNDCDGQVDEGFDKTLPTSCGAFCLACAFPHAQALCEDGQCRLGPCDAGYIDVDGQSSNGCEVRCTPTEDGLELCDGLDNDCDGQVDEDDVCGSRCPGDMVLVGSAFCIDRYEASRADATASSAGTDESVALSQPNVLPWMVNPMTANHFATFQAACAQAGKRLCGKDEWFAACTGPDLLPFVYGSVFDREACNCVDTYCDDYCEDNSISAELCSTSSNCGYTYYCFHEDPTGAFPRCTNDYGTFDINGNVWEVVPSDTDARGYEVRGGAFNCASPADRVSCSFNATWSALYAGFRCCKDPS